MARTSGFKVTRNLYNYTLQNFSFVSTNPLERRSEAAEAVYTLRAIVGKWQDPAEIMHDILEMTTVVEPSGESGPAESNVDTEEHEAA